MSIGDMYILNDPYGWKDTDDDLWLSFIIISRTTSVYFSRMGNVKFEKLSYEQFECDHRVDGDKWWKKITRE